MNIAYITRLTDEATEENNADEYMPLYSSVPKNILEYIHWLRLTEEYTGTPRSIHVSRYSLVK
jgi:hypothetical protein